MCRPGDELHGALRRYKDAPSISARQHYSELLAAMLGEFLRRHGPCLEADTGGWEALSVVPSSTRGRPGCSVCPFDAVVRGVPALAGLPRVELGRGPDSTAHLAPSPAAFTVASPDAARRVLLVDDTWVTGARASSAASALTSAGATVVAIAVMGRSVEPTASPSVAAWWAWSTSRGPDLGYCFSLGCRFRARSM